MEPRAPVFGPWLSADVTDQQHRNAVPVEEMPRVLIKGGVRDVVEENELWLCTDQKVQQAHWYLQPRTLLESGGEVRN